MRSNFPRCSALAASISAIFGTLATGFALAQTDAAEAGHDHDRHGADHEHETLEEIIVTATPLQRDLIEISQSATVLKGAVLERELSNNIGDTLARLPGLSNASFGQNVGRPAIRGLQGVRVGVLNDNMTSLDASALSQDHAVPTEPFLADQVEVLRGPATLIYGSGSIGGVVNTVTNTIPREVPKDGVSARALIQADSAADQRFAAGRIDLGTGNFAFHANGFYRRSDDYEIPRAAELYPDEDEHHEDGNDDHDDHDEEAKGVLENSFLDNEGGAIGASWIGEKWTAGLSYTAYDSDYGIPGAHAHAHGEEEHGEEAEHHDEGEHEEEEELVSVGLENRRIDALLLGQDPFGGFDQLKFNLTRTDYTHTEFEGDETGTVFDNESTDGRLELRHNPWGDWEGVFGGQYTDRDFSAAGEEAFVPPSETRTWALFWVESMERDEWRFDLGLRYEDVSMEAMELGHDHDGDDHDEEHEEHTVMKRDFNPLSFSAAAIWHVTDASHLAFTFASAERAPSDAELFANGPHLATQTFEVGNPDLTEEQNRHYELAWRIHQGTLTGSISLYYDDFRDFIYLDDTGLEEDGLPLREWAQQDAEFVGGEVELRWDLGHKNSGHWQLFGFYDRVSAELDNGSKVPLMPPQRIGFGADWDHYNWAANLTWIHASSLTDTAEFETATPGYELVNAEVSYLFRFDNGTGLNLFLKGRNLLDEDIRNSTSYLKDQAPQIGRNFVLGASFMYR
jgi:iron complex outermembrane receptor protein